MLTIHLDPVGGIAGDMFVAALLDLRPDLEAGLLKVLAQCPLLEGVTFELAGHNDGVLTGKRFLVRRNGAPAETHQHHHHHDHHDHADWRVIREALNASALDPQTRAHALGIFTHLAEAEAKVHGVAPDDVRFHEVGAWDSVADIVAAAWLAGMIGPAHWSVGPVPLGSGRIRTAHGLLPVPAPATALLLEGFAFIDDGIAGERVTPTGAAILRHLSDPSQAVHGERRLIGTAHGFGTRRMAGVSNCLRVLSFETGSNVVHSDHVAVLECEIDDQTAEDLSQAIDYLRSHPGVLDIVQVPVFGKKGRMMTHVRILALPQARDAILATLFDETTTIGVRHSLVERALLPRRGAEIQAQGRKLRIKTVNRPSGRTTKVEADDLADVPGRAGRDALRASVRDALEKAPDEA
ncbi:MAG: LarC family nickel insertion protein [Rhizobiaceae bacterium]|nr:LarC family nickel insertion protein [Rhizobiaceae bacterium]